MDRPHSFRPYSDPELSMYDESSQPVSGQTYHGSSPQDDRRGSRKDLSRVPYGSEPADRTNYQNRDNRVNYDNGYGEYNHREGSRSPRKDERRRYNDRDREGYRSPRYDRNRSRSRSRSPHHKVTQSRTLILEGLPVHFTQEDISYELQQSFNVENLEEVRLIKDKRTGISRQFCFAEFNSVANAKYFLDRNYPSILMYGPYKPGNPRPVDGAKVRIAYSREKEDRDRPGQNEDDWKCDVCYLTNYSHRMMCFRCNSPRTRPTTSGVVGIVNQSNMSQFSGFSTTGDSDVSPDNSASQFLLFRGLEPGVNEELLAKGVMKLYRDSASHSSTNPATAIKKGKIASTSTSSDASGAKEGSLRRVLLVRDRKTNDSWRYGFAEFNTVEDAQAAMARNLANDKFTISSKPVMVSYIHAGVFVPVLQAPAPEFEKFTFSPLSNSSVKLMYWDESGYVSELVTTRNERSNLLEARAALNAKLAAAAAKEGLVKDSDNKNKKRKAEKDVPASNKKVIAPHLQFWTNRHAELHGLPSKDGDNAEEGEDLATKVMKKGSPKDNDPPSESFADLNRKCCLLCSRQFKTEAEVHKHERTSQMHRDNMANGELVKKAYLRLAKAAQPQNDADSSYRDRAKERRQAFNQPKQPAAQHNKPSKEAAVLKEENLLPAPSKGAALLGKMGWTAGEGLGALGTGRMEAIPTELYTQGVGLGAQGGKVGDAIEEAERSTRGSYADFVSKSKDKAKERFEKMA